MRHIIKNARTTLFDVLHGHEPLGAYGLDACERDTLHDMRETLESLYDAYGGVDSFDDGLGTDEEGDADPWDVDLS